MNMQTPTSVAPAAPAAPAAAPAPSASGAMSTPAPDTSTPPAAAPAAPVATPPVADWMSGLKDDAKGYVTNKGWKNTDDLLTSYQNLEKLATTSPDKLVKLPTDDSDKEGWNSVYSKLGRPQTPADYKIEAAKENGNPELAKWASENFFEAGLSTKQAQQVMTKWNEFVAGSQKAQQDAQIAALKQGQEKVQKEWGAAYEQNVKVASRAAREFGIDAATLDKIENAIGFDGVMKLFHGIGSKTGESSFVMGERAGGALTPEAARNKISALQQDKAWVQKYTSGDMTARKEMESLQQMVHFGDTTL